jgi:hypothetical protein
LFARIGLTEEAIKELKAAIAIAEAQPSARPLATIAFRTSLAEVYCKDRRWNDAYETIRDTKDSAEAALGPDHFFLERILLTYADVLRHMHRSADASVMAHRARSIHGKFYADNAVGLTIEARSLRSEFR